MNGPSTFEYTLGLDLGVSSIGFAMVKSANGVSPEIIKMGVRIIPLSKDDETEFTQGNAISKNRSRTIKRTQRKGVDRYQLRRKALIKILRDNQMFPDKHLLLELSPLEIWGMRAKAITEKVSLQELGRIFLHLNQKRGYKHSKADISDDSKQTEYVQKVNDRYAQIRKNGETIGQHFYGELRKYFATDHKIEAAYRIKEKVFPREAYMEEFDTIWKRQEQEYPFLLTSNLNYQIRNEIIYYQRRLKSQKGLVNFCEFEISPQTTPAGKAISVGPKVAPKSSPLFQLEKIWESINNIVVKNRKGEEFVITQQNRQELFNYLNTNERLTQAELFKILGIGRNAGYFTNELIRKKGIQGNVTRLALAGIIGGDHPSLTFNLDFGTYHWVDRGTGELVEKPIIAPIFETEPLYRLWHIIYSLDEESCRKKLIKEFGFDSEMANRLTAVDLTKGGFGNKSARAIRKILPHLMTGLTYDKACTLAGYNHSNSLTKEENLKRELETKLRPIEKNSLRQPVVEKILNQLVNLVNSIISEYGSPRTIRIELARELRQSREERNDTYANNNKREREYKKITDELLDHEYFRNKKGVTKRDIDRYRLWKEFGGISPYEPGKVINLTDLYSGQYDIEHIIPRGLRFDDSFSNKTLCLRRFNSGENAKNRSTAFDYMSSRRSKDELEAFLTLIETAYRDKRISRSKYEKLLMRETDIPSDFISRQLNDTRYISRKAAGLLSAICHHVHSTSGTVTQHLRSLWGWDEILEEINLPKYTVLGLTEEKEVNRYGQIHVVNKILNWSKRDDHRHHAIDALVIACTKQGFIQRINTLNAQHTREEMLEELRGIDYKNKLSLLDNYLLSFKPLTAAEIKKHCEKMNISFKPGKKVATYSSRKIKKGSKKEIVQKNIISPRGALSEESVYGKIKRKITQSVKVDGNFSSVEKIIDEKIKNLIKERLSQYNNDPRKAFSNLIKDPIWIDQEKTRAISQVDIREYEDEYVLKYDLATITVKDVRHIVDNAVRQIVSNRLKEFDGNHKEAFKSVLWLNEEKKIPIKRVRCFTGLKKESVEPILVKDETWEIEYEKYVKPGNNHHIAIYKDKTGNLQEHVVTFWHAVERKKYGFPVIIKDPGAIWNTVFSARDMPESFLNKLPSDGWAFQTSMQQNESFVFKMGKDELEDALKEKDYKTIAPNIYRVRKLTSGAYWFNQQFETTPRETIEDKKAGRCVQSSLNSMTGIKIRINCLGEVFLD